MTTAAITQPSAIHQPPKTIQSRLSRSRMVEAYAIGRACARVDLGAAAVQCLQ